MRAYARRARRRRGAVGRHRPAARRRLRAPSRPGRRRRPSAHGHAPSSSAATSPPELVRGDRLARRLPRRPARDADGEDALRRRRAVAASSWPAPYVRPEGIHGLTPKSVKKKLKQPSFAAAVNRDDVRARRRGARRRLRRARALRHRRARGARRRARAARPARGRPADVTARASLRARVLRAPHVAPAPGRRARRAPADRHRRARDRALPARAHRLLRDRRASSRPRFALGGGAGAPLIGRLIDRFGQRAVLAAARARATRRRSAPLVALGPRRRAARRCSCRGRVVGGAAIPPISARSCAPLWPRSCAATTRPARRPRYALDAVLIELVFVVGPLLTAIATRCCRRAAALVLSARAASSAGTRRVHGAAAVARLAARATPARPRLRSARCARPGCGRSSLATLPIGFCFGAMEVDAAGVQRGRWRRARRRACCSPCGRWAAPRAGSSTARARGPRARARATSRLARAAAARLPAARARAVGRGDARAVPPRPGCRDRAAADGAATSSSATSRRRAR